VTSRGRSRIYIGSFLCGPRNFVEPKKETPLGAKSDVRASCERLVLGVMRHGRADANEEGVTLPQRLVLGALLRAGSAPVTQLAQWTGASVSTLSGIADGLVDAGLVRRGRGVDDRRQVLLSLSAEGRRRAMRLDTLQERRWSRVDLRLSPTESSQLTRHLASVCEALEIGDIHEELSMMSRTFLGAPTSELRARKAATA
jgi:DNA-binding MarR family transcriptional regulator